MYETKKHRPLSPSAFMRRMTSHVVGAIALILLSLLLGMAGYEYFESLSWRDAFLNAAMLLGGMGPVETPLTNGGKLFAGLYALYCGLVFIIAASIVLAPVVHRLLHLLHWDENASQR